MNRQRGFTLIELLVVISITALLMAILMPVLRSASPSFLLIKSNSSISFYGKRLHDCIPYPKTAYSPSSDLKLTATVAELRMSWSMWFVFAHFSLDACGDKWSPLHRWHSTRKEPS